MTFKGKLVRVVISEEAKKNLDALEKAVSEDTVSGKSGPYQILLKSIKAKIEILKSNPQYGVQIPKNRIPKEYKMLYEVSNLWKVNLSKSWRMIYTIRGSSVEIVSFVLDIIDHKTYEKKFRYRKS